MGLKIAGSYLAGENIERNPSNPFFSGMTASRFNLVSSVEGLRQEIREHVFGKELKDLTDGEKKALETYTKGMMAELANLYSTEAQGQATRILDFNRAFRVREGEEQKIR